MMTSPEAEVRRRKHPELQPGLVELLACPLLVESSRRVRRVFGLFLGHARLLSRWTPGCHPWRARGLDGRPEIEPGSNRSLARQMLSPLGAWLLPARPPGWWLQGHPGVPGRLHLPRPRNQTHSCSKEGGIEASCVHVHAQPWAPKDRQAEPQSNHSNR